MRVGAFISVGTLLLAGSFGCGRQAPDHTPSRGSREEGGLIDGGETAVHYRALVIGISHYRKGLGLSEWQELATARPDAEAIGSILADQYGFDVKLLLDGDATREAVIAGLDELTASGSNDAVLVYFAGHGYYDDSSSEGYWIPSDARKQAGSRLAKEDWVWNSTISKLVSASAARHVLVVADSCFAGSLFRGGEPVTQKPAFRWYRRALSIPSRYLITSGDMEPVLDSGMRHSVFAQELLNFLAFNEGDVFSASELGLAVRTKVARITGQMARMGPMAVASHAGGEFVFIRKSDQTNAIQVAMEQVPEIAGNEKSLAQTGPVYRNATAIQSANELSSGASLLAELSRRYGERSEPVELASAYLNAQRRFQKDLEFQTLVDRLGGRGKSTDSVSRIEHIRPRVLACLGPVGSADDRGSESRAFLYRIRIQNQLERLGGVVVVERETLTSLLKEMDMGSSEFVDTRAATSVGKLLPAGLLLVGEVVAEPKGDQVYLRVVDTETSRVLGSVLRDVPANENLGEACSNMAIEVFGVVQRSRPLMARVIAQNGDLIQADIGAFQGLDRTSSFEVLSIEPGDPAAAHPPLEKVLGTASVVVVKDDLCQLRADLRPDESPAPNQTLWIRELPYRQ